MVEMTQKTISLENNSEKINSLNEISLANDKDSNICDPYVGLSFETNQNENLENNRKTSKSCFKIVSKLLKIPFTARQLGVILLLCYGNFCVGSAYSLLAPFFPTEAQLKGASETWIGLIIAEYQIALFLGSALFGKLIPHLTPKYLLTIGLFVAGFCSALFGFLQWSPSGTTFISLGMLMRTIEGLGVAAFFTSCWTIVCLNFPDHISRLFATTEMCYGVGMIFGPAIGGLLNQFGEDYLSAGFCLPFYVMGSLLLLGSLTIHFLLPETDKLRNVERTSVLSVLSNFSVTLNVLISVNCFLLIGFNEATLDLHLKSIQQLSPSVKGGIFVISGALYALFNQLWGYVGEKMSNCHPLCLIGCTSSLVCFLIVGPMPFFPIDSKLWLVIVGQVFLGFGMGGQFVGSFIQGFRETLKCGFADNVSTYAVISGIYSSSFALGSAIGPAIGGYLMGQFGYRWATVPIVVLQLVVSPVYTLGADYRSEIRIYQFYDNSTFVVVLFKYKKLQILTIILNYLIRRNQQNYNNRD